MDGSESVGQTEVNMRLAGDVVLAIIQYGVGMVHSFVARVFFALLF